MLAGRHGVRVDLVHGRRKQSPRLEPEDLSPKRPQSRSNMLLGQSFQGTIEVFVVGPGELCR
jgi:hypothetical protein